MWRPRERTAQGGTGRRLRAALARIMAQYADLPCDYASP